MPQVKSYCRACNQTFNSVRSFDFHRTGTYEPMRRRCLSVEEMVALGMTQNAKGWWQMPARVKVVAGSTPGEVDEDEEEEEQEEAEREVA